MKKNDKRNRAGPIYLLYGSLAEQERRQFLVRESEGRVLRLQIQGGAIGNGRWAMSTMFPLFVGLAG